MKTNNINFLDSILKLPRKIDFFHYSPFAGGDFFISLIILSHEKSKNLIVGYRQKHPAFENYEDIDYKGFKVRKNNLGQIIFSKPQYNNMNYLKPSNRIVQYFKIEELINVYKYSLINSFLPSYPNTPPNGHSGLSRYKDSIILIGDHWIINHNKMKKFSKCKYWDVINLDPSTKFANNLLKKMRIDNGEITDKFQEHFLNKFPFLENMPFLDYILDENYDQIKYWIENRYGSDLDFDFIDKSLPMWKKIRVDPYL
jgi:hypothetical protein